MIEQQSDEIILIQKSQTGDETAFSELIQRYRRKIFNLCFQIINDRELAEDLVQETFISAFRHINSFKMHARFYTWLYRIAVNLSINAIRKQQSQHLKLSFSEFLTEKGQAFSDTKQHPLEDAEVHEIHEFIEKGLKSLPEDQEEVLRLFDLEGFSHQEIAKKLKIKPGTVRSRLHYGRKKLREFMIQNYRLE